MNDLVSTMNALVDIDEEQEFEGFLDKILRGSKWYEGVTVPESMATDIDGCIVAIQPGADEYPLWRIDCRVSRTSTSIKIDITTHRTKQIGLEDIAVMAIYRMASDQHTTSIRSAFTRGSIRGHIYVECQMNTMVRRLLAKIPGVKTVQGGLKMTCIPPRDQMKLLTMKNITNAVERHSWVRIRRGLYQGDEGLVLSVHDWGVAVLLVPRVGPVNLSTKRKASTVRPAPRLVQQDTVSSTTAGLGKDVTIEHGLICKAFDLASVKCNASDMPFRAFQEFMRSGHPIFKHVKPIRPREWQVNVDDPIINSATGEDGVVNVVLAEGVEATLSEGRLVFVPWNLFQKFVRTGDQVIITAGAKTGTSGWVVAIEGSIATVASIKAEGNTKGNEKDVEVSLYFK